jgi:hypothetical protein
MILRHVLQTLPFWCAVILGARNSRWAGWVGLPLFVFWLLMMTLIWMSVLGISHLMGSFSGWEIAMTIVVGVSSIAGITASVRPQANVSPRTKAAVIVLFAVIQLVCLFTSFLPEIAHR